MEFGMTSDGTATKEDGKTSLHGWLSKTTNSLENMQKHFITSYSLDQWMTTFSETILSPT
jgi:hypothetical protein